MNRSTRLALISLVWLQACTNVAGQRVTSPEEHLGRAVGTDFELADWEQVSSFYRKLAVESPNVSTQKIGTTTEGRDFLMSVISSPANIANVDQLREYAAIIADPRGATAAQKREAIDKGKVILLMSVQMHSSEAGCTEAGMQFAYQLATSNEEPWVSARENVVVGIIACTNPDGLDHVVNWYREHVHTPYEATGMLKLYQLYSGHDNNRDWFMLTQDETRIVTEQLYTVWHPQVYWDMHQQGSRSERMFVPPFRDPLNPNLDPSIIAGIDAIGSRALLDMTNAGLTGISTGVTYDMWWNGGNRNVPVRHNIIGLLTEAAGVDIATPLFLQLNDLSAPGDISAYAPSNRFPAPWPGGWWRLSDINRYQVSFGESLMGSLSREPKTWLRNALDVSERVIRKGRERGPRSWIIPSDNRNPDAVARLVDVLQRSGVELHVAPKELTADGRTYRAGSIVIRAEQPYGSHVKDLFEVQRYPDGAPPYDIAGWTLPMLLGVRRVEVMQAIDASVLEEGADLSAFGGDAREGWSSRHTGSWTEVFGRLEADEPVHFVAEGERAGMFVEADEEHAVAIPKLPRIGVYAPWRGSMDEGWTRYVFDTWKVPYTRVRNEMIRGGQLNDLLDVLVIPSISAGQLNRGRTPGTVNDEYTRGLNPEGAVAIEQFVRNGGRLLTFGSSSAWAIDLFRLPLIDVTRESANREFSCPGSVLRGIVADGPTLTVDLPESIALFFSDSSAWRDMTDDERKKSNLDEADIETLLRYAPTRTLLSGWAAKPEIIAGKQGWVRAKLGDGDVHLFGFRPQYRAWPSSTFPLIFRAMLLDP